jgi:molecular chaperone HscB
VSPEPTTTRPIRCTTCSQPLESPICCTSCGELNAEPIGRCNYFELFGLPVTYDVDEKSLHRKYLSLTRSVHPDVAGQASQARRQDALTISSEMNHAYEILRDPVLRAEYMLSLIGEDASHEHRAAPPELLGEIMMVREEIEEARHTSDQTALGALGQQVAVKQKACLDTIISLSRSLSDGEAGVRRALRQQLNAIKYWKNLTERLLPGGDAD